MRKIQPLFLHIVAKIEDYPLPLKRYFLLFGAILGVRLCLEFFANQRLFRADDVIHIGLWFLFIVEAFMLQLHVFSGVQVERAVKLVVCCFSIALTAPLIDLIVSQGKFSKMNYLSINSAADLLWSYVTIGGASLSRGATIGIRIEIVLLVLASFNYVYVKTGRLLRALIGTFSIYTILFLSGTIPFFMGLLNTAFHLEYGPDDQSSVSLLFTLDILLLLVLAYRYNPKLIRFRFSLVSCFRLVAAIGLIVSGALLARGQYPGNWKADPTTLYYFPLLAIVVLALFAYESHGRNLMRDEHTFHRQNGILAVAALSGACISFHTLFTVMLAWGILFFLYEKPLLFRNVPYLSQLLQACLACVCLLMGYMTFGAPMIGIDTTLLFMILISSFSISLAQHLFVRSKKGTS